jgi:hypothetical protein
MITGHLYETFNQTKGCNAYAANHLTFPGRKVEALPTSNTPYNSRQLLELRKDHHSFQSAIAPSSGKHSTTSGRVKRL